MSDTSRSPDDGLAAPLLGARQEHEDSRFDTDGGETPSWTPADSPRHTRSGSTGQTMFSPFAQHRESNLAHLKTHNHMRESRGRRSSWISIDSLGRSIIFQADKRALLQRFKMRLPVRDMRLVDPNLLTSETGKILVRDNGIVVSIEHVRLIIMAEQVIVTKDGQEERPLAAVFVDALQSAIGTAARDAERRAQAEAALAEDPDDEAAAAKARAGVAPLPFELVVLEVALGDVCNVLQRLTKELELQAHPALEALTRDVSTANLERVRKVKTRHQRLMARVTTVREELERFLEDDDDMMKMCLSRRREVELAQLAAQDSSTLGERATPEPGGGPAPRSFQRQMSLGGAHSARRASMSARPHPPGSPRGRAADGDDAGEVDDAEADAEALEALENLLESYFVQIDGTFDKLEAIGEFVEDTEEYINIELDSSRNRLIKLEVVLTAGTFALAIFTLVGGILGENVVIPPGITQSVRGFWAVNGITALVCIAVFYAILTYIRLKRLL